MRLLHLSRQLTSWSPSLSCQSVCRYRTSSHNQQALSVFMPLRMHSLVKLVNKANSGCRIGACCAAIFLYADDIILLAPSVSTLQTLVTICELELIDIDMVINVKKFACSKNTCANVVAAGFNINWVTSTRYLGVYFECSVRFKCLFSKTKLNFTDLSTQFLVRLDDVPQRR